MGQSCGGSQPDPFGQAQPTTYAPPQYSPSAQLVPDPFAHAPAPPAPPPMARQPLLSPETRAFLGVLFVVMGLAGMLVFAIWVTREAYNKYTESTAGRVVDQYISQGDKLYKDGRLNEALEQYKQAAKASEGNKSAAATAKRRLSITCAELAKQSYGSGDYAKALALAKDAVNADPSYDLAHYRLGVASLSANQREVAEKEFKAAVDIGGTTDTAKTARTYLSQLYMEDAANLRSRGDAAGARKKYQEVIDLGDADYMLKAQEELSRT
jgi:tetratricopeptide (TPR) repeat protein